MVFDQKTQNAHSEPVPGRHGPLEISFGARSTVLVLTSYQSTGEEAGARPMRCFEGCIDPEVFAPGGDEMPILSDILCGRKERFVRKITFSPRL